MAFQLSSKSTVPTMATSVSTNNSPITEEMKLIIQALWIYSIYVSKYWKKQWIHTLKPSIPNRYSYPTCRNSMFCSGYDSELKQVQKLKFVSQIYQSYFCSHRLISQLWRMTRLYSMWTTRNCRKSPSPCAQKDSGYLRWLEEGSPHN